jgi:hypothetical protein
MRKPVPVAPSKLGMFAVAHLTALVTAVEAFPLSKHATLGKTYEPPFEPALEPPPSIMYMAKVK